MNKIELQKIKQKALEEHIPIIMDETLEVIEKYLKNNKPKRILEIGTAVGYSAICFTQILEEDGTIDTIERDTERAKEARENIKKAEVENKINIYEGDAVEILPTLDNKYDVVFGPVANDTLATLIRQYQRGYIDSVKLLDEMKYMAPSDQFSFHSLKAIFLLKKVGVVWIGSDS